MCFWKLNKNKIKKTLNRKPNMKQNLKNTKQIKLIILKKETWEIGIKRSGHRYWKPTTCGVQDNFYSVENGVNFQYVNIRSYYINTLIEIFWLKWIFYIKIKPKLISGNEPMRYVRFEETHLELMDIPKGNWNDKNII